MMPNISVLCCARGRPDLVKKMVDSALATAANPQGVEIILRVDWDDDAMVRWLREECWMSPAIIGPRLNGYASLPVFTNEAARLARAETLLVVNDDAEFVTPGWDARLVRLSQTFADGVFLFGIETANADNFIFPCVSRRLVEILGCLFDPRLIYTDIWLRDVLQRFGRAIRVHDVEIKHHWNGMTEDQATHAATTRAPEYVELYAKCVDEAVAKIEANR